MGGKTAYIPLKFALGEAFQFDWSKEGRVIGGLYRRLQVAPPLKLCASRAFVLMAYPTQGHEMLFDAHTRAFALLGGIPRRGIYGNMKTAVDKVRKGKGRIVKARFAALASHYLFDADFCNVASGWERRIVEKNVQESRRRIWIDAGERRFGSFLELKLWLMERCQSLWQTLRHPDYGALSVADMLEHERLHLMPMPTAFDGYVESLHKVSSTRRVAGFDFEASSVDKSLILQLAEGAFTETAQNIVFVGGTGTGKTHLATAPGVSGITEHNLRVRFYSTIELVNTPERRKRPARLAGWRTT
jgi:hypothetical protein